MQPYALALCLVGIFFIFLVEIVAFRWGTAKLAKLGINHDAHGHNTGSHAAHGPETLSPTIGPAKSKGDVASDHTGLDEEHGHHEHGHTHSYELMAQLIGVAILEFGVVLHSVLIGLALAVDESFKILFVVILFHRELIHLSVMLTLSLTLGCVYRNL
jgi:zinc transporter 1/2/3